MSKRLDAIKGDLNTLHKMMNCVTVAMEAVTEWDKKEQLAADHVSIAANAQKEAERFALKMEEAKKQVDALEAQGAKIIADAEGKASGLVAEAKKQAEFIIANAIKETDAIEAEAEALKKELVTLKSELELERGLLAGAKAESALLREKLEGALAKVG
jgi:hypothetical protein